MIWQLLIEIIGLLPMLALVAVVLWKRRQLDREERRDPITTDLRCLPGSSLQEELDEFADSRIDKLVAALVVGLSVALFVAFRRMAPEFKPWDWLDTALLMAAIGLAPDKLPATCPNSAS